MKGIPWTTAQIAYLTANYGRMPHRRLAVEVGHSYRAFTAKVGYPGAKAAKGGENSAARSKGRVCGVGGSADGGTVKVLRRLHEHSKYQNSKI